MWDSFKASVTPKRSSKGQFVYQSITPSQKSEVEIEGDEEVQIPNEYPFELPTKQNLVLLAHSLVISNGLLSITSGVIMFRELTFLSVIHGALILIMSSAILAVELIANLEPFVRTYCPFWFDSATGRSLCLIYLAVDAMHPQLSLVGLLVNIIQLIMAICYWILLAVTKIPIPSALFVVPFPRTPSRALPTEHRSVPAQK